jgi:GntR family transcriptional regulator
MADSTPKIEQVTTQMRSLIAKNQLSNGRLPSEPELAQQLSASRATVRQALASLAMEGLIVRKHGVGTFINQQVLNIPTRLEEVWDFAEMIHLSGYTPDVQHLQLKLGSSSAIIAQKLALAPESAEVLTTTNIFLADGAPVIYCIDIIPANLINEAYRDEELHGPVYAFLEKRCQQRLDHNIAELLPVVADDKLSQLLHCPIGSPLHYFKETGFNKEGMPIIYSEEYYRPEYFSFNVIRKKITTVKD